MSEESNDRGGEEAVSDREVVRGRQRGNESEGKSHRVRKRQRESDIERETQRERQIERGGTERERGREATRER